MIPRDKMSKATIPNSGKEKTELEIAAFFGGKEFGVMLQLTQGFGGCSGMAPKKTDEPGFIQLTFDDVVRLIEILSKWKEDYDPTR